MAQANRITVCARLFLVGVIWTVTDVLASAGLAATAEDVVRIRSDGSLIGQMGTLLSGPGLAESGRAIQFQFGLPRQTPARQWREDDRLPICHSRWETNHIRYTQTVFLTRLEADTRKQGGLAVTSTVLVVQIFGENLAGEYTEASAGFAVQVGERWLDLELKDGFVYAVVPAGPVLLAAVDVPPSGIERTSGSQLRFRGNMPPGTSGSMTFKIPFAALGHQEAINGLRDLEFDLEFTQVKQFWKTNAATNVAAPVTFAESELPVPK